VPRKNGVERAPAAYLNERSSHAGARSFAPRSRASAAVRSDAAPTDDDKSDIQATGCPKKSGTFFTVLITSSNIDRFSNVFPLSESGENL